MIMSVYCSFLEPQVLSRPVSCPLSSSTSWPWDACDRNQEAKVLVPQKEPEWKQAYFKGRLGQNHAVLFLILPVWCLLQK